MKAYSKSEKEVICFVCKKPIQSRDDLILIKEDITSSRYGLEPVHIDCFGEVFRKKPHIKPYKKPSLHAGIGGFLFFSAFTLTLFVSIQSGREVNSDILFVLILTIFSIIMFFNVLDTGSKVNYIWETFEEPLPATCSRCGKYIPSGKVYCPTCRKKYDRTQRQLKKKLKN